MTMDQMLAYDRIINSTSKFHSVLFFGNQGSTKRGSSVLQVSILAYDPTITEWDLYYWFTEAKPYPKELIKDESYIADYAKEEIQGMVLS